MITRRTLLLVPILLALGIAACSAPKGETAAARSGPVSVRGWIADVELPPSHNFMVTDPYLQIQRKYAMFRETAISVEGVQYVSGGVAETGAFIMLDVPSGDSIINFQPPGLPDAQLRLRQIPGSGDVLLPGLIIKGTQVVLFKPENAMVRLPGSGTERKKLDIPAFVSDQRIDVWEVPLAEMVDRREYPTVTTRLAAPTVPTVK
jgi:hypothetical protein